MNRKNKKKFQSDTSPVETKTDKRSEMKEHLRGWTEEVRDGKVFRNKLGCWCRICPDCNNVVSYSTSSFTYVLNAHRRKSRCLDCQHVWKREQLGLKPLDPNRIKIPIIELPEPVGTIKTRRLTKDKVATYKMIKSDCPHCGFSQERYICITGVGWDTICWRCSKFIATV
jgi:hypothetical protein